MYPQGGVLFARQAEVGGNIFFVLIKDIIVRVQLERAECQDRIVREQMEVETFFHLVGTQSEQDTGFPQAVRVQEFGIGKRIPDLPLDSGCERSLLAEFRLDDIGLIQQSERVLPDRKADCVYPRRVLHQVINAGIQPETFFGRGERLQVQVVERDVCLLQYIINRIILPCRYGQMHIRQQRFKGGDIDHRIFLELFVQPFGNLVELIGHGLQVGVAGQHDPEVAGMEGDAGGVLGALGVQGQCLRFINTRGGSQFPVSEGDVDQVVLSHVGFRFREKLEGGCQRIVH